MPLSGTQTNQLIRKKQDGVKKIQIIEFPCVSFCRRLFYNKHTLNNSKKLSRSTTIYKNSKILGVRYGKKQICIGI